MKRDIRKWWSPRLQKDMEIATYGHFGFALLLFPTAAADYLEYERFLLIDAIRPSIEAGRVKVYSINSINSESWMNSRMRTRDKAIRHELFNGYVTEEVVPFIFNTSGGRVPIITSGASLGSHHAVNTVLRRPDLFEGVVAMSGNYNLRDFTGKYWDENCYHNSPMDYVPGIYGEQLHRLQQKKHIHIVTGQGAYEDPDQSRRMSQMLWDKGIPNELDVWGRDMTHDWPTWRKMLPYYLSDKLWDLS